MTIREKYITMLYISTLGRMPDTAGFNYWVNSNLTIAQIAKSFFDQKETQELYPKDYSIDKFVDAVYHNLFDREPDEAGKRYWINELKSGNIKKDYFIISVIYGASSSDRKILEKKIQAPFIDTTTNTEDDLNNIQERSNSDVSLFKYNEKIQKVSNINYKLDFKDLNNTPKEAKTLISGYKWDKNIITYTFNSTIPNEYYKYGSKYTKNWKPFTEEEKVKVRDIFKNIEKFVNLKFQEVPANGDIRFNHVDMPPNTDGFTRDLSDKNSLSGDIWISNYPPKDGDDPGTGRYLTLLHEIGHALGLKHPFEGNPKLPQVVNDTNHTVMSYNHTGAKVLEMDSNKSYSFKMDAFPYNYPAYDIEALQSIYGVNTDGENSTNTTYFLSDLYNKKEHMVIWDTGGVDTINLSDTKYPNYIDMRGGKYSSIDVHSVDVQKEELKKYFIKNGYSIDTAKWWSNKIYQSSEKNHSLYTGENNLSIVNGVIIENIITGSADDVVIDNKYDNIIKTGKGNDKIFIRGGAYDQIYGGDGIDKVYFSFPSSQAQVSKLAEHEYLIDSVDENHTITILKDVELIGFTDTNINLL